MDPVLELQDVEKHFYLHEREKHLLAFEAINFSVDEGALLAITGPSGGQIIDSQMYLSLLSDSGVYLVSPW